MILLNTFSLNILNLIQKPKESHINDGVFSINSKTVIYYDSTIEGLLDVVNYVVKNIQISTNYAFKYSTTASYNQINFVKSSTTLGPQDYILSLNPTRVTITSTNFHWLFIWI